MLPDAYPDSKRIHFLCFFDCRYNVTRYIQVLPYERYVCALDTYTLRCARVCTVFQANRISHYICTTPVCLNI